jgi:hypothetical protein
VFGFLISGSAVASAQDSTATPASVLPSLEATPAEAISTATDDAAATSDLVLKGFIPDLQRAQMMQDAVDAAKKAEQKKAAANAASKPQASSEVKASVKTSAKQTETAAEKERKAKEAADRANGITAGKTATASASAKKSPATAKPGAETLESAVPPAVALDNKPSVKKAPAHAASEPIQTNAPETIVEEVPSATGQPLGVKKPLSADEQAAAATEGSGSELTFTGRVVSAQSSTGGKLKILVESSKYGTVEVVVQPRIGMRVPVSGASVTVRGQKLSGDEDKVVVRAESIDRGDSASRVVYKHGYIGRVAPVLPMAMPLRMGPPPMVYGPPPPGPYF